MIVCLASGLDYDCVPCLQHKVSEDSIAQVNIGFSGLYSLGLDTKLKILETQIFYFHFRSQSFAKFRYNHFLMTIRQNIKIELSIFFEKKIGEFKNKGFWTVLENGQIIFFLT